MKPSTSFSNSPENMYLNSRDDFICEGVTKGNYVHYPNISVLTQ